MKRIYTYMCLLLLSVLSFAVTGCDDDDDDDVAKDLIELIEQTGNTYRAE